MTAPAWADVRRGDLVVIDGRPHVVEHTLLDCTAVIVETRDLATGRRESSAHPATLGAVTLPGAGRGGAL